METGAGGDAGGDFRQWKRGCPVRYSVPFHIQLNDPHRSLTPLYNHPLLCRRPPPPSHAPFLATPFALIFSPAAQQPPTTQNGSACGAVGAVGAVHWKSRQKRRFSLSLLIFFALLLFHFATFTFSDPLTGAF